MPSQFVNRGDRLVFSNGVVALGLLSSLMIYVFDADLNTLIHFYVVGVFTSFTLSQSGMVRHWLAEGRKGEGAMKGWRRSIVINIIGAITTFVVLIVVILSKFKDGAWLSILIMALLVPLFYAIHRHYTWVRSAVHRGTERVGRDGQNHVVLLVATSMPRSPRRSATSGRCHPRSLRRDHPARRGAGRARASGGRRFAGAGRAAARGGRVREPDGERPALHRVDGSRARTTS